MKRLKLEVEIYHRKIVIYSMKENESEDMVKYLINNEKDVYPYCIDEGNGEKKEGLALSYFISYSSDFPYSGRIYLALLHI